MANFLRKFIKGFASLAAPLYDLCKNKVAFEWGEPQNNAFLNLKKALTSKPYLAFPKNQDFILHTDESGTLPANTDDELKTSCLNIAGNCTIKKNGCLYFTASGNKTNCRHDPLFVPIRFRGPICVAFHQSSTAGGHFNWKKTLAKIKRRFYWPQMKEDIFKYVRSCDQCQRIRPHPFNKEKLLPVQIDAVLARVYLDLSGPYRTSARGNKYILCLVDHFTKYVVSSAVSDCTAITVANAIVSECILKYGAMTELVSDNASYLKGDLLAELGKLPRIGHYFTTPYHHEGNGACERVFATFQEMLRTYTSSNQLDWDLFLPACTFAYNTSVHSSTNETPFFLLFGRDPFFNIDLLIQHTREGHILDGTDPGIYKESLINALHSAWLAAFASNEKRNRTMKRQYDKSHLPTASIQLGDRVYLRDFAPKQGLSQKPCYPWLGQFRVIGIDPPHLTLVSIRSPQSKPRKVHMNQVKKRFELSGPVFTCPWIPSPEEKALTLAKACNRETLGYSHALTDPVFTIRSSSPQGLLPIFLTQAHLISMKPHPTLPLHPHPAYPPLLEATPEGYVHRLVGQHPWAQLVIPLHERQDVSENQITSELPTHVYRHLGNGGYLGGRFVRSLFLRKFQGIISPSNPVPFIELMRLDHAVALHRHADSIIREVMRRRYRLVGPDLRRASKDRPPTLILPPRRDDVFPVLYQVVAKNRGQGIIVEARDFFIPGPDHMELHCVVFDQFAANVLNDTRGFDLQQVDQGLSLCILSQTNFGSIPVP
ncbi:integrase core domain protein [Oesophagostomum dentatum]|uniref:RNA-directed DNA polymerase n=1 Tax=Oesophagostomum dentatum TaxID=61180 RepID=A0A0B1THC3_OESDE|nr:integrase core domain protein [Oesophagostomum dentatum]